MWNRRDFLTISSLAGAAAASGVTRLAFGQSADAPIVVVLFLRGGVDSLNLLAPVNDPNYTRARSAALRVVDSGAAAGWSVASTAGLDFRAHAASLPLRDLYQSRALAFVHATGLMNSTRSHFEAMDMMERGVIERTAGPRSGWLTRFAPSLSSAGSLPSAAIGSGLPASFLGAELTPSMPKPNDFSIWFDGYLRDRQLKIVRDSYAGTDLLAAAGRRTLNVTDVLEQRIPRNANGDRSDYQPRAGANYPTEWPGAELAESLKSVAQLIKLDLGLQLATLDFGDWDHHDGQEWRFRSRLDALAKALAAFYADTVDFHNRLVLVTMSEFGRRLKANNSGGTDHGHGGAMMLLGQRVQGGRMYGSWPGLADGQLDQGDLAVTTDYRAVLAEVLSSLRSGVDIGSVFPGLTPPPRLGLVV
jgi:uncharacterized protein (DUF1501 family)